MFWAFLIFSGTLFLLCVYNARASLPEIADLCFYAGQGEATYNPSVGRLHIRLRAGGTSVSTRRDRSLPSGLLTDPLALGTGNFEVWTDPRPTRWIAGLLGRQIWQASKDGTIIIPYELTAKQERDENRIMGPLFAQQDSRGWHRAVAPATLV